jgi:tRNA(fMet)-specific endonuclease VapC
MYLLDTDHLSLLQRQGNSAQPLMRRLQLNNRSEIAATVISYEEQTRGWMKYFAQAKNLEQQVIAYQRLQQHAINYCNIVLVPFDTRSAEQFQQLRKQYPRHDGFKDCRDRSHPQRNSPNTQPKRLWPNSRSQD